jgi:hypothetical protein
MFAVTVVMEGHRRSGDGGTGIYVRACVERILPCSSIQTADDAGGWDWCWQEHCFRSAGKVDGRRSRGSFTYRSGYTSQRSLGRIGSRHSARMGWVVLPVRNISKREIFHKAGSGGLYTLVQVG